MSKTILRKIIQNDFKGSGKNREFDFGPGVNIMTGPNGSGKSTTWDAFLWAMTAKDSALRTNPDITDNRKAADACETTVTMNLDCDGKPVEIVRFQKTRFSKPDANGIRKATTTNTYSINSVTMSERDAGKKLAEYGIDMDLFLTLCHTAKIVTDADGDKKAKDNVRSILLSMASLIEDKKIALRAGCAELADMLDAYTIDEVAAQQKATRRKILDSYGKNGENLNAKITALEGTIVRFDEAALEQRKAELEARREELSAELEAINSRANNHADLIRKRAELTAEMTRLCDDFNRANAQKRNRLNGEILKANSAANKSYNEGVTLRREQTASEMELNGLTSGLVAFEDFLATAKARKFDESTLICPTCGRPYDAEQQAEIRAKFKKNKADTVEKATQAIDDRKAQIKKAEANIADVKALIKDKGVEYKALKKAADDLVAQMDALPGYVREINTEESRAVKAELESVEAQIKEAAAGSENAEGIKAMISRVLADLAEIERRKAQGDLNRKIEEKIAAYREQQREWEQTIADTEKIDNQIIEFSKKRNELLTDSVNEHFNVVKWVFFKIQKNGGYAEVLVPMVGNTPFSSLSGGEKIVAMVDITVSLQKWYGMYLPVFIDEVGIATSDTVRRIKEMAGDTQLIMLKAADTEGGQIVVERA